MSEQVSLPKILPPTEAFKICKEKLGSGYRFISLEGAEILIAHREHGSKTVKVEPYNILRLRTINTSNDYTRKRNRAAFRALNEENIDV